MPAIKADAPATLRGTLRMGSELDMVERLLVGFLQGPLETITWNCLSGLSEAGLDCARAPPSPEALRVPNSWSALVSEFRRHDFPSCGIQLIADKRAPQSELVR